MINVNISQEHQSRLKEIKSFFKNSSEFIIEANYFRKSDINLPMQIIINLPLDLPPKEVLEIGIKGLIGGAGATLGKDVYDLLKAGIRKIYQKFKDCELLIIHDYCWYPIDKNLKVRLTFPFEKKTNFGKKTFEEFLIYLGVKTKTKPLKIMTNKKNRNIKSTKLVNNSNLHQGKIEIYQTSDNKTEIAVRFEGESFWLSLNQIAELFDRNKSVISRHLKNIFAEKELEKSLTVAKNATVQIEGEKYVERIIEFYNLDAIISVGYRVNSKQGTRFRIWATERLKNYLIKGFSINEKRVKEYQENLVELQKTIKLIQNSVDLKQLSSVESKGFLDIITNYTNSFILLNRFDSDSLNLQKLDKNITYEIAYEEALEAILELKKQLIKKKEATALFGNQKDQSFAGILGNITQSFGGKYLYKTIEEQASHLLYFVIKNHPFSDGNKRIGAFLFIWFLTKNKHSLKKSGELKINDNGLVALALLVAQSNPKEKELMIKLIINLINEQ